MRVRISGLVGIGLCLGLLLESAAAISFDVPATLGDQRVDLRWTPESDDPFFTGNLQVFYVGEMPVGAAEIAFLVFTRWGGDLYAISRGGETVARLKNTAGEWAVDTLLTPLPAGAEVTCLGVHPTGNLLAAGLADGRIAIWRPGSVGGVSFFDGHGGQACRGLTFKPQASAGDSSFVSVGEDGRLIEWSRPEYAAHDTLIAPDAGLYAVAITQDGERVFAGHGDGQISVWTLGISLNRLLLIDGHPGQIVNALTISEDGRRFASADAAGTVRVWDSYLGRALGSHAPQLAEQVFIAFTAKASDFIAYAFRSGEIGVLDGYTGRAYNAQRDLGRTISAFALSADGLVGYFGGEAGHLEWWHQGQCIPSAVTPSCFGGYRIFRGVTPDDLVLLRSYQYGDTTWLWSSIDSLRAFGDPDSVIARGGDLESEPSGPFNGVPYYYSLVKYYRNFQDGAEYPVYVNDPFEGLYRTETDGDPIALIPRVDPEREKPLLGGVYVVPNPYIDNDPLSHFGPLSEPLMRFYRLPESATIRIYTMSGDLVRTLHHDQDAGGVHGGSTAWDLKNESQKDVISAVYVYVVDTPSGERTRGILTIVR